jgi:hypothetical protein
MRIRDLGWKKFESGINIPDPQLCDIHTHKYSEVGGFGVSILEILLTRFALYGTPTYVSLVNQGFP